MGKRALFAQALPMTPSLREKVLIQSKCSILPGVAYDCSKEHILKAVEGSLTRLNTEYLDVLLLHRPDALVEPEEVAEAFRVLKESGKVRHFGVSNHSPGQMALLEQACGEKLLINQLQLSIAHCPMIDAGLNVNIENDRALDRDGDVLNYCRLRGVTIQAWSPFQYGMFQGTFLGSEIPRAQRRDRPVGGEVWGHPQRHCHRLDSAASRQDPGHCGHHQRPAPGGHL